MVLVNFWAVWCQPCLEEMPLLGPLQAKYGERGLGVLAVNVDDDTQQAKRYLEKSPPGVQVIVTGGMGSRQAEGYRVQGIPLNVLVDRNRRVAQILLGYAGAEHESLLSSGIETLLDEDEPPVLVVRK